MYLQTDMSCGISKQNLMDSNNANRAKLQRTNELTSTCWRASGGFLTDNETYN